MNKPDLSAEIKFQTTRSGGKGGQHVNKVETAVIGSFQVDASQLLTDAQKQLVKEKLAGRINTDGFLQLKAQTHRSQAQNKEEVIERLNALVCKALQKKKPRIATKPSRAAKEQRLEHKKRQAEIKSGRKKFRTDNF